MSLALATGQTIAGSAGTASAITYTLTGDELSGTPVVDAFKVLAQGTLGLSTATIYTSPVSPVTQALVKTILLKNVTAGAVTAAMFANGTAATNQLIQLIIPANGSAVWADDGWSVYDSSGYRQYAGATGPQGLKGLNWQGAWSSGTTYAVDDAVYYATTGQSYRSLVAGNLNHTPPATNDAFWFQLVQKGDTGLTGTTGSPGVVTTVVAGAGLTGGGSAATVTVDAAAGDGGLYVAADALYTGIGYGGVVTGASKTYAAVDRGKYFVRSNSGSAMTDTLPSLTNTAPDIGFTLKISNAGTVVAEKITFTTPAGTMPGGGTTYDLQWGCRQTMVWNGTAWFFDAGNGNIPRWTTSPPYVAGNLLSMIDTTGRAIQDSGVPAATVVANTRTVTAGTGLAGGGDLSANRTISMPNTGPGATGPLGSTSTTPIVTIDAQGRVTALTSATITPAAIGGTPSGRLINTTAPITGGGDLSADRTIALDITAATAALNLVTTSLKGLMSAADKIKMNGEYQDIVADWGADPTGAVDATTIIQNAVNSFGAGGGRLYFPAGSYKVDLTVAATITIAKPVIIFGAGRSISNIVVTHATKTVFTMATGAQGAGFEQIRITGSAAGTRTAGHMVDFGALANVYMQQCDIIWCWSGVHSGGALQFIDDMNIREVSQNAASGQAILVDSTGDRYVRRLTTDSGASIATAAGVRINECSSVVISDSNIIHAGTCVAVTPNAGGGHQAASIWVINSFLDTSHVGFSAVPATNNDSINRVRLIGCWLSSMVTAGVILGNAAINVANTNSVSFIGCEIYSNPVGIDSLGIAEWDIRASRIAGCSTAGIRIAQGLQASVQAFTVSDNFIGNGAGFGANGLGINIQAGAYGRYQVLDNRGLDTNTTPGITDLGTVTYPHQKNVINNMGAGLLPGTIASRSTTLAVANTETVVASFKTQANISLKVGTTLRFTAGGLWTNTTAASTASIRVRIGTTTLTGAIPAGITAVAGVTARTAVPFEIEGMVVILSVGAGGTALGWMSLTLPNATVPVVAAITTAAVTVVTTVDNLVELTFISGATTTVATFSASVIEVTQS